LCTSFDSRFQVFNRTSPTVTRSCRCLCAFFFRAPATGTWTANTRKLQRADSPWWTCLIVNRWPIFVIRCSLINNHNQSCAGRFLLSHFHYSLLSLHYSYNLGVCAYKSCSGVRLYVAIFYFTTLHKSFPSILHASTNIIKFRVLIFDHREKIT
jgi:hypothetical protein